MKKHQVDHVLRAAGRITGAKYVARREKDIVFNREIVRRGLVTSERLHALLEKTPVGEAVRERIRADIGHDFAFRENFPVS